MRREFEVVLVPIERLRPHEMVEESRIRAIMAAIQKEGIIKPLLAAKQNDVLLDGHHRLEALRRLDAVRVPVVILDYDDDEIILESWRGGKITKMDVVNHATSGDLLPVKTTKHLCITEDGKVHLSRILQNIHMSLEHLRKDHED